jgi:hypothetical protein
MPKMDSRDDLLPIDLDEDERRLLCCGISEWGGPANGTDELAIAMGFTSLSNLFDEGSRIVSAIECGEPLVALDWFRALLATEVVWSSRAMGAAWDWTITTGFDDAVTLDLLRRLQGKMPREVYWTGRTEVGTMLPPRT